MSPYYDMEFKGDSMVRNAEVDVLVTREIAQSMASTFLGDASPKDPLANPLYADLKGMPPMYIQIGGYEALLDDSTRFETKAKAAGVDIKIDIYPEMQHGQRRMIPATYLDKPNL